MAKETDEWKRFVLNPQALVESDKETYLKIESLINELLNELKANNKIETNYTPSEIYHVKKMLSNMNNLVENYNLLIGVVEEEKAQDFMNSIEKFGFKQNNFMYLIIGTMVLSMINETELFKTLLLFHLKDVDHKVSRFNNTMSKYAPKTWKKLEPLINSKFRNALAHGNWAMENDKIVLFEDSKLVPFEKLDYMPFIETSLAQNRLFGFMANTISKKIYANFFVD